jgi:2,4-dienoyl-CoA reductase-like NADH-dependent reductase (Old Yellow Enzyme family)
MRSDCSADMSADRRRQRVEPVVEDAEVDELAQLADRVGQRHEPIARQLAHAQRRQAAKRRRQVREQVVGGVERDRGS